MCNACGIRWRRRFPVPENLTNCNTDDPNSTYIPSSAAIINQANSSNEPELVTPAQPPPVPMVPIPPERPLKMSIQFLLDND